jgi:predicted secreted Zn-dependent protease
MKINQTPMKIRLYIIACLLLISLACSFGLSPASDPANGPTPTAARTAAITGATIQYYDIRGTTAADLRDQMNTLGPIDAGRHWDAHTGWYIHWNWPGYGTNDCNLSQATTSLDITVTLPRWANPKGADTALITQWNKYYAALAHHEQTHVDNANTGLVSIKKAILAATCATAEQAAQNAIETIHETDRAYDEKTNHGAAEGARFP